MMYSRYADIVYINYSFSNTVMNCCWEAFYVMIVPQRRTRLKTYSGVTRRTNNFAVIYRRNFYTIYKMTKYLSKIFRQNIFHASLINSRLHLLVADTFFSNSLPNKRLRFLGIFTIF